MTRQAKRAARLSCQHNLFQLKTLSVAVAVCLGSASPLALANPTGASVASGSATFASQGNTLTVTNSNGAIINWQQFNIGANETTRFVQPSAQSSVLNRVTGGDPSQIFGTLQSNGQVFLINPNGILFGRSAVIDVPGLIASTLNLSDADYLARRFNFAGGGFGSLVNQGRISTALGGSVWLVGSDIRNEGIITTPQGHVVLAAGDSVSLVDTAGPELSVTLTASGNKALNLGEIDAAGGRIDIFGALIEQQGVLRADSASVDAQGRIVLKASDSAVVAGTVSAANSAGQGGTIQVLGKNVTLTGTASLDASGATGGGTVLVGGDWQGKNPVIANARTATMEAGAAIKADATGNGHGGKVVLWSDGTTDFKGGIFARGGARGGDGGQVETSGHSLRLGGTVNTSAAKGATGFWLLDPAVVCFDTTATPGTACSGSYDPLTHGYTSADVTYATPDLVESMLQSSDLYVYATDYIANLPNGGTWTLGSTYAIPAGRTMSLSAPHIYFNGTYDFRTNGVRLNTSANASGTSASFPSLSDAIVFDSGSKWLLAAGASGQPYTVHTASAGTIEFRSGSSIDAPYGSVTDASGYSTLEGEDVALHVGTLLKVDGGSVKARNFSLDIGGNAEFIAVSPLAVDTNYLSISAQDSNGFQIGTESCAVGGCWGDSTKYFSGPVNTLDFWFAGTGDLSIVGNFNPGSAKFVNLHTGNRLSIDAPVTLGNYQLNLSGSDVAVNSAISTAGGLHINAANAVDINGAITGTGDYSGLSIHGTDVALNANITLSNYYSSISATNSITIGKVALKGSSTATTSYSGFSFSAPTINNQGGSVSAAGLSLAWDVFTGSPLSAQQLAWLDLHSYTGKDVYLGAATCPTGAWCLTDVGAIVAGSYKSLDIYSGYGFGDYSPSGTGTGSVHVDGPLKQSASEFVYLGANGKLYINAPIALGTTVGMDLWGYGGVQIDQPVSAENIRISAGPNADILLNSALTAAAGDYTFTYMDPSGSPVTYKHPSVMLWMDCGAGSTGTSACTSTGKFINQAGANAIATAAGGSWALSVPQGVSGPSLDLGGLDAQAYTPAEFSALGFMTSSSSGGTVYAHVGKPASPAPVVDPCVLDPKLCVNTTAAQPQPTSSDIAATPGASADGTSTLSAPLTIDAKLTVSDSPASSTSITESTTTALDAPLAVARKGNGKTVDEIRAEAKASKEGASVAEAEAKRAEAEAKQAEAEAKEAEMEAKSAKSADAKAAARQKIKTKEAEAEAKKAEAEAKKAEAEAKKAEAEAKKAEADSQAEAKGASESEGDSGKVKQTQAEARQAKAEAKQAEAEARQAEAESKQAAVEAKAAKDPDQKAAAQKTAEAKKIEAEAKTTEAEAKKVEAEAKQAETEAKTAPTPEARAAAVKRAEAKQAEAEVKKTEAESKQAQADGKQAEAQGKQAEVRAKAAQAEAKQAEAEAKAAKTPEEKQAAAQKAEVKKTEAEAHKIESEAKNTEAEARKTVAEAKKAEVEVKKAEAEAKQAQAPEQKAAAEKRAETKRVEAEVKKTEAEGKQAQAESKQAEAQGKQSEARAKAAQAEAKQAEAEAKSAKAPEEKLAATRKAEVKKTEAEAHKTESEARKAEAEGKKIEAEAKKAEVEVKKAEAEAKQAKVPEQKAAAEKKVEAKQAEVEAKKTEAEAKHTEAEAKQAKAEAKQAEAEAKGSHSPGGRAVAEKRAEAKQAEGEHKQAEAEVKKAEAEVKKAEATAKKAEAEGKKAEAQARKAEAEARKAEVEAKRAEAEKKKVEALKKAEAFRLAAEKRKEQRRTESAKAFAAVATAGANRAALENLVALRHELKAEALKPALSILASNPGAADLPPCGSGSSVCVPVAAQVAATLPPPPVPKFAFLPQIQRKVAVVVGVNKYADPAIPSLESALPDAEAVGQQLKEQLGYDVRVVADATRADIVTSLNKLSEEVGPNDSVTVYYAGHGYLSEKTKTGYWIPADAKATSPANWISNNDIAKLLANIPAKQVMLVSDSCYSGSLTKEQKITAGAGSLDPTGILARRSVTVMSSGGEEPVSDEGREGHSIFAYSFMNALKSVKQVDSGVKLFDSVRNEVSKDFPQTPQYGGAISAGHTTGGDYLFEARSY